MADVSLLKAVVPVKNGWYCVLGLQNGKPISQSHHQTLEEVEAKANELVAKKADVFFGCGKFMTDESRSAANCGWMQSFFLDIDCGADKAKPDKRGRILGYVDQAAGLQALKNLCKTLKLPRPTIVNSGRGWHVYWPLIEAIEKDKWLPVAETFKKKCLELGFIVDPAVPADAARVLRIPGTKNFKSNPPTDVTLMHIGNAIAFNDFATLLGPVTAKPKAPFVPAQLDEHTRAMLGNRQSRFKTIIDKTAKGRGCEQLRNIIENQEDIEEPLWRAGLSIAKHCIDGAKAIHLISKNHSKYDRTTTEEKASSIKGPYTCNTFDSFYPNICSSCPHKGKIKSPIVLGHEIAKSKEGAIIPFIRPTEDSQKDTTFIVPKLPSRYFRGKNGGIYKYTREEDEEGDGTGVACVYEYDLFVTRRLRDPQSGETILIRLTLPRDGVKEFALTLVEALSKEELRKVVSFNGVIALPAQMNLILEYLVFCARELQTTQEVEIMRMQMGWADKDQKFILGEREITATSIRYSPISKATKEVAPAIRAVGNVDEWKDIYNTYNLPGFEPHAFATFSAFGAPLIKFMGIKGSIINLVNNKSGTGKSTILQMMNSVYGHPDELMLQWRDTMNVKLHRMAVMCNLPLGVDEITKMNGDDFSDLAYASSQGAPRRRMKASANEERASQGYWATTMVATSNAKMTDKLMSLKATSEGELMRLFEYKIETTNNLDPATAKHMFGRLQSNYGLIGQDYIQFLVQNLEEVVETTHKMQLKIDQAVKIDTSQRFWSAQAATNLAGGMFAHKLGLHSIDYKRVFDWTVNEIITMQGAVRLSFDDYAAMLGEFLLKHNLNTLVVNRHSSSKAGIAAAPIMLPRGALMVRFEPDTKKIFIIKQALKDFCVSRQLTYTDLISALNKTGAFIAEVRTRLDVGTDLNAPPVIALEFDADLLGVDLAPATTADAS